MISDSSTTEYTGDVNAKKVCDLLDVVFIRTEKLPSNVRKNRNFDAVIPMTREINKGREYGKGSVAVNNERPKNT